MKSNILVLRHQKFTNNQICLAVFSIIIYACWNVRRSAFQRHLLLSVPKEILKSIVFCFQVLAQQRVHPHGFTFLQWKDRTGYPQGAVRAALKAQALSLQLNHSQANCCTILSHSHSPETASCSSAPMLFFWNSLQPITNATSPLVMWTLGQ